MQNKAEIMSRLQNDIRSLQGYRPATVDATEDYGLGPMVQSFPNARFPFSALHEFTCNSNEESAATTAFIAALLSAPLKRGGQAMWIGNRRLLFPPALKAFGINADQLFFVELSKEKEVKWALEEALKCIALTTVVVEIGALDFTESRRLQLLIERSGVGCFLLRYKAAATTTASTSRWQVKPLPSNTDDGLPGVGHPRWQVSLHKVRNGKTGNWVVEWNTGQLKYPSKLVQIPVAAQQIKTG